MSINNDFKGYTIEHRLGHKSHMLILSKNGHKYVAKLRQRDPQSKSFLNLITNKLDLTKLQFQEELFFLKALNKINFTAFNYPHLVDTNDDDYFILECIEGDVGKWQPDITQKKMFAKVLVDFQTSAADIKFNWKSKLLHPLFRPVGSVLRLALTNGLKYGNVQTSIKVIFLTVKLSIRNKRQKNGFMLRRDFIPAPYRPDGFIVSKNMIFGHDGTIYFIDFERPVQTRKFFLSDMVDISFYFEKTCLDWTWFGYYMEELNSKVSMKDIKMDDQIRIALLRNVLTKIALKTWRGQYFEFLTQVLLSDVQYKIWLESQKFKK